MSVSHPDTSPTPPPQKIAARVLWYIKHIVEMLSFVHLTPARSRKLRGSLQRSSS